MVETMTLVKRNLRQGLFQRRRDIPFVTLLCGWSFVIAVAHTTSKANSVQRFDLSPTSALLERKLQRRSRGRRRLEIPKNWLHPYVNAIYATLQPPLTNGYNKTIAENATFLHDDYHHPAIEEFHALRHFSRYERLHQQSKNKHKWNPSHHDSFQWYEHYYSDNDPSEELDTATVHRHLDESTGGRTLFSSSWASSSSSRYGGQFNHYQSVPLSQGYGTHYVAIWVGSPNPQRQSVIVDTGSHFTAFPCSGCFKCGAEHHTDPYFNPSRSTSFHALQCHECIATSTACDDTNAPNDQKCRFTQSYTEGSSWQAYQARDYVFCSGPDVLSSANPLDHQMAIKFFFGCLTSETGLFVTQLADGIMGMSAHETTLVKQLYNAGKIEHNMFAMCFRRELGTSKRGVTAGSMTLGGVSTSLDSSPMVYAKNVQPYGWFTVFVKGIYIAKNGGTSFLFNNRDENDPRRFKNKTMDGTHKETKIRIKRNWNSDILKVPVDIAQVNSGKGVIVDSGTTDTYLNIKAAKSFSKIWKQVTGMEYTHSPVFLTQSQLHRLPTILIQCQAAAGAGGASSFGPSNKQDGSSYYVGQVGQLDPSSPHDLLLAIPATHYMEYSPALKLYTSRLYFTETRGGVLGANAMQGHNVVFDWENGRVGFAQSSCAYDNAHTSNQTRGDIGKGNGLSSSHEEGYARDCHLSPTPAVLSTQCIDTIDVRLCLETDQPTNVALSGTEIWTRLVQTPGTKNGKSCVRAIEMEQEIRTPSAANVGKTEGDLNVGGVVFDSGTSSLLSSHFLCPGDGLCLEYRPCEVSCVQVLEHYKHQQDQQTKQDERLSRSHSREHISPDGHDVESEEGTFSSIAHFPGANSSGASANCGDTYWSACDTSCRQTRMVSAWGGGGLLAIKGKKAENRTFSENVVDACVEVSRKSRPCHIDACAREDPCRVPFLVHAIFHLKGGMADKWNPHMSLDLFQRALFFASHNLDPKDKEPEAHRWLFQPGDVDVMSVRPWWDSDDDNKQRDAGEATSSNVVDRVGDETHREATSLGLEIVVQVSIFNPKAQTLRPVDWESNGHSKPNTPHEVRRLQSMRQTLPSSSTVSLTPHKEGTNATWTSADVGLHQLRHRNLLQEIGDMVRNMTIFRRKRTTPESTCSEADFYPLAKDAVSLATSVLQEPNFISRLIGTIERLEQEELAEESGGPAADISPFRLVYVDVKNRESSRLVAAWTVGTNVFYDSEINYFGPIAATPYVFALRICYEASVLFLIISVGSVVFQALSNHLMGSRSISPSTTANSSKTAFVLLWMRRSCSKCYWLPLRGRWLCHCLSQIGRGVSSCARRPFSRYPVYLYEPLGRHQDDEEDPCSDDNIYPGSDEDYIFGNEDDASLAGKLMGSFLRPGSILAARHSKKEEDSSQIPEIELANSYSFSDIHTERRNSTAKRRNSMPIQHCTNPITIPPALSG